MPRRTIGEARAALEDLLSGLSDYQANEARSILESAESGAREFVSKRIDDLEASAKATRDEASRELTTVRDALDDLRREGSSGRLSSTEYTATLNELTARKTTAEQQLGEAGEVADRIEEMEADPVAAYDALASRFPTMGVETPW